MSLILHIDTALSVASVCLSKEKASLGLLINENQQGHAAWLHSAIDELMKKCNYSLSQLDAISVSIGPGSYTGLRVGLSSAKGLSYALKIPLITIPSTTILAAAVKNEAIDLICPLIDARRMEVFTAIYDKNLNQIKAPYALIIEENSFDDFLNDHSILFCGDGCKKLQSTINNENIYFSDTTSNAFDLAQLAYEQYNRKEFADLAYVEPLYIKEFYSSPRKN